MSQKHYEDSNLYPQHLTWVTSDREPYFESRLGAMVCLWALEKERQRLRQEVWGYCLMPDHLHILIAPSIWPTGSIVQWFKLASAFHLKAAGLCKKSPWQRGYWDRAITDDSDIAQVLTYIHDNAVKADVADSYESWLASSWQDYENTGSSILRITPPAL